VDVVRNFCRVLTRTPLRIHLVNARYIYFYILCYDYLIFSYDEAKLADK